MRSDVKVLTKNPEEIRCYELIRNPTIGENKWKSHQRKSDGPWPQTEKADVIGYFVLRVYPWLLQLSQVDLGWLVS